MALALRAWAINRGGKNSVRNLRYCPRTRLVRVIYSSLLSFCTICAPSIQQCVPAMTVKENFKIFRVEDLDLLNFIGLDPLLIHWHYVLVLKEKQRDLFSDKLFSNLETVLT